MSETIPITESNSPDWRLRVGSHFNAMGGTIEVGRKPGLPREAPAELAKFASAEITVLERTEEVQKLTAIAERANAQRETVLAAQAELTAAEQRFNEAINALINADADEYDGGDLEYLRANLEEQRRLFARMKSAYDSARRIAELKVASACDRVKGRQLDFLRGEQQNANDALLAAMRPHLERITNIIRARSSVMFGKPIAAEFLPPPLEDLPSTSPALEPAIA